jgi:hypothetical protein
MIKLIIPPQPYVYLSISSFIGISPDAEHCYGELTWYSLNDCRKKYRITHKLTRTMALMLNKKDSYFGFKHLVGEVTDRYETEKELIDDAVKYFKRYIKESQVLINGDIGIANVREVLVGPEPWKSRINALYKRWVECDGYDNKIEANIIDKEYIKISGRWVD